MDTAVRVQILDEALCVSHSTDTFRKGIHPIILPPAMVKTVGQTGTLNWVRQPVKEKETEFKSLLKKLTWCRIQLMRRGWVNT